MKKTYSSLLIGLIISAIGVGIAGYYISERNEKIRVETTLEMIFSAQSAEDLKDIFDESVLDVLNTSDLFYFIEEIQDYYGSFQNVSITEEQSMGLTFYSYQANFLYASTTGTISFNSWNSYVNGFFFGNFDLYPSYLKSLTWEEIYTEHESLPGNNSLLIAKDDSILYLIGEEDNFAVGSTFKMYVLKALENNITNTPSITWESRLAIRNEWKSLPSGILHTFDSGIELTLREYADYMINISDNTATDHLINWLGREYVESFMPSNYEFPLLTTYESFCLRWAVPSANRTLYLSLNESEKRNFLENNLTGIELSVDGLSVNTMVSELELNKNVEWWFNITDLYSILKDVKNNTSMQKNPGLAKNSDWESISYKGGADVGVLCTAHSMFGKDGNNYYCIQIANNYEELRMELGDYIYKQMAFYAVNQKILGKLAIQSSIF